MDRVYIYLVYPVYIYMDPVYICLVYPGEEDISTPSYFTDDGVKDYQDSTWYGAGSVWLKVHAMVLF